jgi:regulator of replication initiation timing
MSMHEQDEKNSKPTGQAPPDTTPQRNAVLDDVPALLARLQRLHLQLETLKQALAVSEQETAIARGKLGKLAETESALLRENTLLEQKVDQLRSELLRLAQQEPAEKFAYLDQLTGMPNQ